MKLLLYCTKEKSQKDLLWSNNLKHFFLDGAYNRLIDDLPKYLLNGKIVAECDFEVEEIEPYQYQVNSYEGQTGYKTKTLSFEELLKRSCLTSEELYEYLGDNGGYAIHIKNLNIFDEPKELSDYYYYEFTPGTSAKNIEKYWKSIKIAPQNMRYCATPIFNKYFEEYTGASYKDIIISVRPEWVCLELNGEKTTEVRKKVLKRMMQDG